MLFSVSVLLRSRSDGKTNHSTLWQENIILCSASCIEDAKKRAEIIGHGLECEYKSVTGKDIKWEYDCVLSAYKLERDTINDRDVIFTRHLTTNEITSLKKGFSDNVLD